MLTEFGIEIVSKLKTYGNLGHYTVWKVKLAVPELFVKSESIYYYKDNKDLFLFTYFLHRTSNQMFCPPKLILTSVFCMLDNFFQEVQAQTC